MKIQLVFYTSVVFERKEKSHWILEKSVTNLFCAWRPRQNDQTSLLALLIFFSPSLPITSHSTTINPQITPKGREFVGVLYVFMTSLPQFVLSQKSNTGH